jgi:hypothetical protein
VAAPERQDRSVDSVEWAAVDDREKIVRFPTRSEPVLSLNDGFGANRNQPVSVTGFRYASTAVIQI